MISRRHVLGRPVTLGFGSSGSRNCHWSSVRSVSKSAFFIASERLWVAESPSGREMIDRRGFAIRLGGVMLASMEPRRAHGGLDCRQRAPLLRGDRELPSVSVHAQLNGVTSHFLTIKLA